MLLLHSFVQGATVEYQIDRDVHKLDLVPLEGQTFDMIMLGDGSFGGHLGVEVVKVEPLQGD